MTKQRKRHTEAHYYEQCFSNVDECPGTSEVDIDQPGNQTRLVNVCLTHLPSAGERIQTDHGTGHLTSGPLFVDGGVQPYYDIEYDDGSIGNSFLAGIETIGEG